MHHGDGACDSGHEPAKGENMGVTIIPMATIKLNVDQIKQLTDALDWARITCAGDFTPPGIERIYKSAMHWERSERLSDILLAASEGADGW